jgi:hypothetical protein
MPICPFIYGTASIVWIVFFPQVIEIACECGIKGIVALDYFVDRGVLVVVLAIKICAHVDCAVENKDSPQKWLGMVPLLDVYMVARF